MANCITPSSACFYAILSTTPRNASAIHLCNKPFSTSARPAFQALAGFVWRLWVKIHRSFDVAFQASIAAGLEESLWRGDWLTQDFFDPITNKKLSILRYRFRHEVGSLDQIQDDIVFGTHWVEALKWRDGLSLEMVFTAYKQRHSRHRDCAHRHRHRHNRHTNQQNGMQQGDDSTAARPATSTVTTESKSDTIHVILRRAKFHACDYLTSIKDWELFPIDGSLGWFRIELEYSQTPAFPQKEYEQAFYPITEPAVEAVEKGEGQVEAGMRVEASTANPLAEFTLETDHQDSPMSWSFVDYEDVGSPSGTLQMGQPKLELCFMDDMIIDTS